MVGQRDLWLSPTFKGRVPKPLLLEPGEQRPWCQVTLRGGGLQAFDHSDQIYTGEGTKRCGDRSTGHSSSVTKGFPKSYTSSESVKRWRERGDREMTRTA